MIMRQDGSARNALIDVCLACVPNHGDFFCHLIDQIIRLNLAVKDSLRILRDSLRTHRESRNP